MQRGATSAWADAYRLSCAVESCAAAGDLRHGAAAHGRLLKSEHSTNASFSLWNKLLKVYLRSFRSDLAGKLFDVMPRRDVISYNTMISACSHGELDRVNVISFYSRMLREEIAPTNITLSVLLTSCKHGIDPQPIVQIHAHAVKLGLSSDGYVGSALVKEYQRCRGLNEAINAFCEVSELDSVSWNIMIDACARSYDKHRAMEVFSRMRMVGDGSFDCFTLTSVLKTCLAREDISVGMQLHACALKANLDLEMPVGNALVTMYSRCEEAMDSAIKVFRRILEPNIISWTAVVSGMMQNGLAKEAIEFYNDMVAVGVRENEFCFASILPAFGTLANLDLGRKVHARIIKSVFSSDVTVGNALLDMYFKCGVMEDAQLAFDTMPRHDVVSWTMMVLGFGQHGKSNEALEVFEAMQRRGFKPDSVTFLATLSACSHGGLVNEGLWIFHCMINVNGLKPKREHYACLIDVLGRAGRLKEAERFIGEMGIEKDPEAWEALLGACGMHGEKELGKRAAEKLMELEPYKDGSYVLLSNIYAEQRMWEEKSKVRESLDVSGLRKEAACSWF